MARVTRQDLYKADPTIAWKLILRALSTVVAFIAIGLIAWAELHTVIPLVQPDGSGIYSGSSGDDEVGSYYADDIGGYDGNGYDFTLPWEFITLGVSIIWSVANLIVWFTPSRSGRGIHPGANVGCDLVLWLGLLITGLIATFAVQAYVSDNPDGYASEDSTETYANGTTITFAPNGTVLANPSPCDPFQNCDAKTAFEAGLKHKGIVCAAGVTFTFILMLFHFAFFISACRYTHARRREKGGAYARDLTDQATVIAARMVKDMGYPPPGQWQPQPQSQAEGRGQQATPGALPMQQPQSYQPMSGMEPAVQHPYQAQMTGAHNQASAGNWKGKEKDLEQGKGPLGSIATRAGEGSSGQYPPHIRVDAAGDGETGMIR